VLDARLLTKSNPRFNPSTGSEGASTRGSDEEAPKRTFSVTVERLIAQSHTFEIEAESADEAHDLAEEEITNIDPADWDDHFEVADPEVIDVAELGHAPNDDDESDDDDTAD
jgi:hypothetical protein